MSFDNYCGSYKVISLGPRRLLRTQFYGKKANFTVKTRFWHIFFWYDRTSHLSANKFYLFTRPLDKNCSYDKIVSLGRKKSIETNISHKSCFHSKKSFWSIFRRFIECDKPRTPKKGLQGILTTFEDVKRSFL